MNRSISGSENRRAIKPGELLAIDPRAIHSGPDAYFWLFAPAVVENEYVGSIAIINISGPLDHHPSGGDSYDSILTRAREAFGREETSTVVLRIDSPGGVVSGLNETVASLRKMSDESNKELVAFVDEMATSAAYALCCACDQICIPASGICGSIGVISTMVSQTEYDQKQGFRFVTITSGDRKADGHPHVDISEEAISSERKRVDELATQFFKLVRSARAIPVSKIKGFQAGIFLGKEALAAGLVDAVLGAKELFPLFDKKTLAQSTDNGSALAQVAQVGTLAVATTPVGRRPMTIALASQLRKTKAAIAQETDPKKKKSLTLFAQTLQSSIEAYKKVKHTIEKHEEEEGEEDEEDEEEEEAKGNETDRKEESDDDGDEDKDEDKDDDEDEDEEDDEEEASAKPMKEKAIVAALQSLTGRKSSAGILGAVQGAFAKASKVDNLSQDVKFLKAKERTRELDALMKEGVARGQFKSPMHAKEIRKQGLEAVKVYLSTIPRGMFLATAESQHVAPEGKLPEGIKDSDLEAVAITPDMQKFAEQAHMANPNIKVETFLKSLREAEVKRMNGKGLY